MKNRDYASTQLEIRLRELIHVSPNSNVVQLESQLVMAKKLTSFCTDAIDKFIAGQLAHGGDIRDRNLLAEANKEVLDLFWYLAFEEEKQHNLQTQKPQT